MSYNIFIKESKIEILNFMKTESHFQRLGKRT